MDNVVCPKCGSVFAGHSNIYGKICPKCWEFIPPAKKIDIVVANEIKLKQAQAVIRNKIRKPI